MAWSAAEFHRDQVVPASVCFWARGYFNLCSTAKSGLLPKGLYFSNNDFDQGQLSSSYYLKEVWDITFVGGELTSVEVDHVSVTVSSKACYVSCDTTTRFSLRLVMTFFRSRVTQPPSPGDSLVVRSIEKDRGLRTRSEYVLHFTDNPNRTALFLFHICGLSRKPSASFSSILVFVLSP